MKRYNKITVLLLIAGAGVLQGCDFLDRDVPNKTSEEEWWQTYSQLETAVGHIYRYVPSGLLHFDARDPADGDRAKARGNQRVEQEGITDNCIGSANYVDYTYFDTGTVPTNDPRSVTQVWEIKWSAIRRACRFLDNYQRTRVSEAKLAEVTRMAAEVRALRAYYHLELFMYYGEIPIVSTTTKAADQNLARESAENIVEWITSEFELAARDLPVRGDTNGGWVGSEPWRFTQGACYAWMSYLYLYTGDWENAKLWAKEVMDSEAYELFYSKKSTDHYSTLFIVEDDPEENKEAIFIRDGGMCQARVRLAGISAGQGGQTVISPTMSLVNEYELADGTTLAELSEAERDALIKDPKSKPRDPRLTASILFPMETYLNSTLDPWTEGGINQVGKTNSTTTGYWVKKWSSEYTWKTSGDETGKNDFYLMRYAVVLLNYAEAVVEMWDTAASEERSLAYKCIDDIRTRAGMPVVDRSKYNTREKMRELVRRERRVELAFEGHRLMDMRRWKIGKEVMNGTVYGAYNTKKNEMHVTKTRTFNDRDYLWPIPSSEMSTNANMVQNPGY